MTTFSPTVHTGILRCNEVVCEGMRNFSYVTPAEKSAVLAANSEQPWRCVKHERKTRGI